MNIPLPKSAVKDYYAQLSEISIEDVARDLLGTRITGREGHNLTADCPNHASTSKKSLHIDTANQLWHCFGCGVGGNVLHLVEFVQSGTVTKGVTGRMPESHQRARDYLAEKSNLSPLSSCGLSQERLDEVEADHAANMRAMECLTRAAQFYHYKLTHKPAAYQWLKDKYRLSDKIIKGQCIGYADNVGLLDHLKEFGFTEDEIFSSGIMFYTDYNGILGRFRDRITFPYWTTGGYVDYMIARETPWTDEKDKGSGSKYKKLPVHNEQTNKNIAKCINNARLHNEHVLLSKTDYVIIAEGVTDNLSAMDHDIPSISPVTVRIRNADWPRLLPKLSQVKTVYVVGDNEVSKAGLEGSLQIANILRGKGIDAKIVTLPLSDEHKAARKVISERWGIKEDFDRHTVAEVKKKIPESERAEYDDLCAQAKLDLNAYFVAGHSREDFLTLLAKAVVPIDFAISRLDPDVEDLSPQLEPILREASGYDAMGQEDIARAIKERVKGAYSLDALKRQIRTFSDVEKRNRAALRRKDRMRVTAPQGSLKHLIQTAISKALEDKSQPDWAEISRAVYMWFTEQGATARVTRDGSPLLLWDRQIFRPLGTKTERAAFHALLFKMTDLMQTSGDGRQLAEGLTHEILNKGTIIDDQLSWIHTDHVKHTVYFNLNNERGEIAKISSSGIELIPNGCNYDNILLQSSSNMKTVNFLPEADCNASLEKLIKILEHLTCSNKDKSNLLLWFMTILLIDYSSTRPIMRFEGPTGSGKTTGADFFLTLVMGEASHMKLTIAAAWALSALVPLLCADNIETAQQTDDFNNFLIIGSTCGTNVKRKAGTDSEVVRETPKCLLCTTGIEGLGGGIAEITNRQFVVDFDPCKMSDTFMSQEVFAQAKHHRDAIFSWLMACTSRVLGYIEAGGLSRAKAKIVQEFRNSNKVRSAEFLALMWLSHLAGLRIPKDRIESELQQIPDGLRSWLADQDAIADEAGTEDNVIVRGVRLLFKKYAAIALDDDDEKKLFRQKYVVNFSNDGTTIQDVSASDLFMAFSTAFRDHGQPFPLKSAIAVGKRLQEAFPTLKRCGFNGQFKDLRARQRVYKITFEGLIPGDAAVKQNAYKDA